jgi:two-component system cell cycle sensor histidine kinase/response regulator CckA
MNEPVNQDSLNRRIAELEAELESVRSESPISCVADIDLLADIDQAADGICVCHAIEVFPYVRFTLWNRRMVDLTGYGMDEINRKGWYQTVYPDPEIQAKAAARMAQMREGWNLEAETWEITRADGTCRTLRISTSVLAPKEGPSRVMAVMHDTTEDRHAEAQLRGERQDLQRQLDRQTELLAGVERARAIIDARYRALFEIAGDALFVENDRDEIVDVNHKACELLGCTRDELLTMKVCDIQAPECRGEPGKILKSELATYQGQPFETLDLHKDGTRIPVEVTNTRLAEAGLFISIVRDARERKAHEQAQRETFDIIEKSPVVAFLWRNESDWPVEFVTANVVHIFGYSNEDFLTGRVCYAKVVHPDDIDRVASEVATFSQDPDRSEFTHAPYRIVARNGDVHWITDSTFIRRDTAGAVTHYQGIVTDVTDRIRAEEALTQEKESLAVTLRSIGDAVITADRDGRIVLMNPIAERLTGWNEADAAGRQLMDVFRIEHEQTGEPCESPVDKVLSGGQIVGLANHTVLVARDGQRCTIADSGAPILDLDRKIIGVVLVFRDITAQQRTEAELLKMEKLKSIGVLAGGIAHDFNNFLTGIIGNLSLARLDAQAGDPVSKYLGDMEKAALRAKELTQQLLTFSKGGEPVKRTADVSVLVREAVQFALHGSNVRCKFDIDAELMAAKVDENQIAQVIHNLIINADQAMPNGGKVWIRGANARLTQGNPFALLPGEYIQVTVQDHGIGIHPDHLKKVFDPYFTTKQKGSGLGLAVAYNIVAKHDGQMTVDSKLGEGTTFTILLPATTNGSPACDEKNEAIVTGRGRVLVMDDEDFIRELAVTMLTKLGYDVITAPDGRAAVDLYLEALETETPFDAVILDLTVPGGMGGKGAIAQLAAADPNVRAIVSSGYSNDPVMADYTRYGFCGAVKKPYPVQEMSRMLRSIIKT